MKPFPRSASRNLGIRVTTFILPVAVALLLLPAVSITNDAVAPLGSYPSEPPAATSPAPRLLRASMLASPTAGSLSATKSAMLDTDVDGDTRFDPGDTIKYQVVITASGADATNVNFADTIDANTTFVAGTLIASPIAVNDTYQTIGNVRIVVPVAQGVIQANDLNPNGSGTLTVTKVNATNVPGGGNATASTTHGSVTLSSDGSFNYTPNAGDRAASDSFTYTLDNGTGLTDTATVTINLSGMIWFVDNTPGPNGDGRLTSPFREFGGAGNSFNANATDAAGDAIFVYTGNSGTTPYTGGVTLLANQKLIGQGAGDTLLNIASLSAPSGTNQLPATGGTRPVITAGVNNIILGSGNTVRGVTLNVTSTGVTALTGSSFGTLTLAETAIGGTNGQALNLNTGTLTGPVSSTAALTSLSSTNSGTTGLSLTSVSGAMSSGSTTVSNSTGAGISVNTSSATLSFGTTSSTGSGGTAISLTTNTGTITFGALTVTPDAGQKGFVATDNTNTITVPSGTVTTSNNTAVEITRSTGVAPNNTTPLTVSLTSVNATGGTSGMVLTNTSGSFTVTGNGGDATVGGNGTGGTISGMSGAGVNLTSVTNISFTSMKIQNGTDDGIRGNSVTGFTLSHCSVLNNGNATTERGIEIINLLGSATISSSKVNGNAEDDLWVQNNTGTLNQLTVTGSEFKNTSTSFGNDGIQFQGLSGATMTIDVSGCTFDHNRGDHFQMTTDAVASGTVMTAKFQNNTLTGDSGASVGGQPHAGTDLGACITINPGGAAQFHVKVSGNTITGAVSSAITLDTSNSSSLEGTVSNNIIGTAGTVDSGSSQGDGINLTAINSSTMTVSVSGNTIKQYSNLAGINITQSSGSASVQATVTGNTISNPGTFAAQAVFAAAGASTGDSGTMCLDLGGAGALANSFAGAGANGSTDFRIRQRMATTVRLPGYAGGNTDTAAVVAFIQGRNTGSETGAASVNTSTSSETGAPFGGGFIGGAACASPTTTSIGDPVLASAAQVVSDGEAPASESGSEALRTTAGEGPNDDNIQKLRPEELNWMVQAALARWAETGLASEDLARLRGVTFEIARLPEGVLASAEATQVKINETAAGYGWFVDQTPQEDSEFLVPVPGKELQTTGYSMAHGKVDLLTVLMRQLGMIYLQDRARVPKALRPLMDSTLSTGVRRLPDAAAITLSIASLIHDGASAGNTSEESVAPPRAFEPPSLTPVAYHVIAHRGSMRRAVLHRPAAAAAPALQGGPLTKALGTIPAGESVTVQFKAMIKPANMISQGATQVCNTAGPITADGGISVQSNQVCNQLDAADLSVSKSANAATVCSTSNITYTITYNNAGPGAAANPIVSDPMPANTHLVSVTTPATWSRTDSIANGGNGTLTFSKASSANADTAQFTVVVSIDPSVSDGAVLSNQASVTSDTLDTSPGNNTSSPATTVTVKTPPTPAAVGGNQTICALSTTAGLGGNPPTSGTGMWTIQSGGTG
ncbi:MAG TPA: Ig-like domain-containing protein, partial [Blastocatellia bacterium]|nr:Ig-like domain-containing protein [Blastocatellia bacterium]